MDVQRGVQQTDSHNQGQECSGHTGVSVHMSKQTATDLFADVLQTPQVCSRPRMHPGESKTRSCAQLGDSGSHCPALETCGLSSP